MKINAVGWDYVVWFICIGILYWILGPSITDVVCSETAQALTQSWICARWSLHPSFVRMVAVVYLFIVVAILIRVILPTWFPTPEGLKPLEANSLLLKDPPSYVFNSQPAAKQYLVFKYTPTKSTTSSDSNPPYYADTPLMRACRAMLTPLGNCLPFLRKHIRPGPSDRALPPIIIRFWLKYFGTKTMVPVKLFILRLLASEQELLTEHDKRFNKRGRARSAKFEFVDDKASRLRFNLPPIPSSHVPFVIEALVWGLTGFNKISRNNKSVPECKSLPMSERSHVESMCATISELNLEIKLPNVTATTPSNATSSKSRPQDCDYFLKREGGSQSGCVTPQSFAEYLRFFGPFPLSTRKLAASLLIPDDIKSTMADVPNLNQKESSDKANPATTQSMWPSSGAENPPATIACLHHDPSAENYARALSPPSLPPSSSSPSSSSSSSSAPAPLSPLSPPLLSSSTSSTSSSTHTHKLSVSLIPTLLLNVKKLLPRSHSTTTTTPDTVTTTTTKTTTTTTTTTSSSPTTDGNSALQHDTCVRTTSQASPFQPWFVPIAPVSPCKLNATFTSILDALPVDLDEASIYFRSGCSSGSSSSPPSSPRSSYWLPSHVVLPVETRWLSNGDDIPGAFALCIRSSSTSPSPTSHGYIPIVNTPEGYLTSSSRAKYSHDVFSPATLKLLSDGYNSSRTCLFPSIKDAVEWIAMASDSGVTTPPRFCINPIGYIIACTMLRLAPIPMCFSVRSTLLYMARKFKTNPNSATIPPWLLISLIHPFTVQTIDWSSDDKDKDLPPPPCPNESTGALNMCICVAAAAYDSYSACLYKKGRAIYAPSDTRFTRSWLGLPDLPTKAPSSSKHG